MLKPTPAFDLKSALRIQLEAAVDAFENLRSDDAVHRGRVALKRARALARLAQHVEPALSGQIIAQIRPIMSRFSHARDMAALEACAKHWASREQPQVKSALLGVARRLAAKRKALEAPNFEEAVADVRRLTIYLTAWPDISDEAVALGAEWLVKRARKGFERTQKTGDPEARHVWRKRVKERLYAIFLLGHFWPQTLPRRRASTQRLGETLGVERDVSLLLERLRAEPSLAGSPDQADRAIAALMDHLDDLRKQADKFGRKLHAR